MELSKKMGFLTNLGMGTDSLMSSDCLSLLRILSFLSLYYSYLEKWAKFIKFSNLMENMSVSALGWLKKTTNLP